VEIKQQLKMSSGRVHLPRGVYIAFLEVPTLEVTNLALPFEEGLVPCNDWNCCPHKIHWWWLCFYKLQKDRPPQHGYRMNIYHYMDGDRKMHVLLVGPMPLDETGTNIKKTGMDDLEKINTICKTSHHCCVVGFE